eukprot:2237805-Prymnesium_polylepis.1
MRARCAADLKAAADAGLRACDFGDIYTGVEVLVGRFVASRLDGAHGRAPLLLHTKLVPDLERLATFDGGAAREVVLRSCARLQTGYVDLLQLHWWDLAVPRYVDVAAALVPLRDEGA